MAEKQKSFQIAYEKVRGKRKMNKNYNKTLYACFVGYIVQAIVNNFVPLLFLTFQKIGRAHV